MGASAEVADTEETPPSWAESFRIVWQVRTLRRIFVALPFVAVAIVGLSTLSGLYYDEVFNLDERARGFTAAGLEGVAQFAGLMFGIPLTTRLMAKGPGNVVLFLGKVSLGIAVAWLAFAAAPTLPVAIVANALLSGAFFLLIPGIYVVLSLAVPAKVRAFGFAIGTLFILPGLLILPVIGGLADTYGIRVGLALAAPVFLVGGMILASAGGFVAHDIAQVWKSTAARSEVAHLRRQGKIKLLLGREIDVHYDNVQVLFGVDFEVDEGEIVALMGTNGAGKSTLLKAISGLVQASGGAIVFDGRDMTHTPPDEIAGRGVSVVPGGQGVFTQLSVGDNLRLAAWNRRKQAAEARADTDKVLDMFPVLRERLDEPAGNLSGGQQQMLTLGMAFIGKPRLLMVDELSLGLAPSVVTQLLGMVRSLRDDGTTVILVEQSVNVALTVADRAYFMEKGEIRFEGPTTELLERPDLLRSVFLRAAATEVEAETDGAEDRSGLREGPAGARGPRREPPVRWRARLDGVSFDLRPGEILGFIGPNGAGKTTLFDVISGYTPADTGSIRLLSRGAHGRPARRAHPRALVAGAGPLVPGRAAVPGLTVHEAVAVALEQHVQVRDPIAASLHLPSVGDSEKLVNARVDEPDRAAGARRLPRQVRARAVHRHPPGGRPRLRAGPGADGPAARRAVQRHRPARGRGAGPHAAPGPRPAGRQPAGGRARPTAPGLDLRPHDRPRPRAGRGRGPPADVIEHPAVVASYLGTDEAAITRSGAPTTTG